MRSQLSAEPLAKFDVLPENELALSVTLSEGVRRPSRRVSISHVLRYFARIAPLFGRGSFGSAASGRSAQDDIGDFCKRQSYQLSAVSRAESDWIHRSSPSRRDRYRWNGKPRLRADSNPAGRPVAFWFRLPRVRGLGETAQAEVLFSRCRIERCAPSFSPRCSRVLPWRFSTL